MSVFVTYGMFTFYSIFSGTLFELEVHSTSVFQKEQFS